MKRPRVDWRLSEENVARYLATAAFVVFSVWLIADLRGVDTWLGLAVGVILSAIPTFRLWVKHLDDSAMRRDKAENAAYGPAFTSASKPKEPGLIRAADREEVGGYSMGIGPGRDDVPHPQPSEGDEGEERYP